ncbi:phosphate/phosphite/phosphonate ABC transporter substrate-binding protein [Planktotalea sp.]|uniref:phosphate/phosphite/phosphonate ABC transporter substrate-binding protein n=1 Tax=Planktotalea sp. TaxID=2029877 RepID=UPI003D6C115A
MDTARFAVALCFEKKVCLMIASLIMYERAELQSAHARYWQLIHRHLENAGISSPKTLSQSADATAVWLHPELALSQTCGMPYRNDLREKVTLVGTPDFDLANCPAGYYRSAFVVRAEDPRKTISDFESARFAYNQLGSQSGYAAAFQHTKPRGFWFNERLETKGHLLSAQAVAQGRADIAALDGVTWRNLVKYDDFARDLRVLEWTAPTPGLPYITSQKNDADAVFGAVKAAIAELSAEDSALLGIKDIVRIPKEDYFSVPNPD